MYTHIYIYIHVYSTDYIYSTDSTTILSLHPSEAFAFHGAFVAADAILLLSARHSRGRRSREAGAQARQGQTQARKAQAGTFRTLERLWENGDNVNVDINHY